MRFLTLQSCLNDIIQAEENGYPKHLLHKLLIRKCNVLIKINRLSEAQEVFNEATSCVNSLPDEIKGMVF